MMTKKKLAINKSIFGSMEKSRRPAALFPYDERAVCFKDYGNILKITSDDRAEEDAGFPI